MTKRIIPGALVLMASASPLNAAIPGQWKSYPSFDTSTLCIVPTPVKTFFVGYGQTYNTAYSDYADHDAFLFAYDKEGDEIVSYGRENYLSSPTIKTVLYNPAKRYLCVAYVDGNIDLIYDDGSIVNIDALKNAGVTTTRDPNSITFDTENGHIYLACNFGYIVIDDSTRKIINSRIYNVPVYAAGRIGDKIILSLDDGVYMGDASAKLFAINDYTKIYSSKMSILMPLSGANFAFISDSDLCKGTISDDAADISTLRKLNNFRAMTTMREGYYLSTGGSGTILDMNGNLSFTPETPGSTWETVSGSWDGKEVWQIVPRQGLASYNLDGSTYTATRTGLFPNVPNAFRCHNGLAYSPKYGVLVNNHEVNLLFPTYNVRTPALTSGLKNGIWTSYGYPYTNPDYASSLADPNGLTIDPDNENYIYYGSFFNGVQRKNLADPTDVLHLTHPSDGASKLQGYVKLDDDDPYWSALFDFTQPQFDNEGNLWMLRMLGNNTASIYCWPSAARRSGDTSKITKWNIAGSYSHQMRIVPLKHSSNKNLVLVSTGVFNNNIHIIDTKGTPSDPSDDTIVTMSTVNDQDGNRLSSNNVYDIVEDPATGTVWVVGSAVLYTFSPQQAIKDPSHVTRIKVARDDGTNLADYLLDNVTIYKMAIDSRNRKWFATNGAGLVVTSSDGRTIIDEINTTNSDIPDDMVYSVVNNPAENSIVVSTRHGIAEFIMTGSASDVDAGKQAKVYPNPVRPDYLGWITIEDLPENAVVKICDAFGNLVKELGIAENGVVQWDGTNTEMKRVKSGVYHIFSSSSSESESSNPKGKVLIVN